ncbi:MAG: CCA tRNA nucleotidyltransferase [Candidatus Micrarchaeota archaeon]|nr:CCA tRNA nucleotidyltransferase [Candidatus Micrarchaeota archaeon]
MKCADEEKAKRVFAAVLSKIKPSPQEIEWDFSEAERLIKRLERVLPEEVEVELAGSLAKGTNLKGKDEFDIFLLFPKAYPREKMTRLGLQLARRAFRGMKIEERYAEHPYLQVFAGKHRADVVPAYRISEISQKGSSVDRSQLHTRYVNSKLNLQQKDEVRLLKAFMKNFGIYGAELRVEGFSGYLCELLIARYGSLLALMEAAADWKQPAIDIENCTSEEEIRKGFASPLVVIDPVDRKRNVAAVVSQTSLSRFIFECRRFLASPSERFFLSEKKVRSLAEIKRAMESRGTFCAALCFEAPAVVPDILWPQLKKTANACARYLSSLGFSVFGHYYWSDMKECVVFFELEQERLPSIRKAIGPSIQMARDVEAFVRKHRKALNLHLEHDRIVAVERREVVLAEDALCSCKKASSIGIPANIARKIGSAKIRCGRGLLRKEYAEFLSDYFFAKIA